MLFLLPQVFFSVVVMNKVLVFLLTCYSSYLSKDDVILFVMEYYLHLFQALGWWVDIINVFWLTCIS